ncbi:MAG: fimbrillin family protein, partial [Muribaculaceae bacterium]|nr:fimbrillin family protein [Muribaculaceae bacterium]
MSKILKTTILVAAGVAFTLASCSEDETIAKVSTNPGERQEIEFTLDMMSRATDRTITNLDTIWVYADDGAAEVFPATAFI